MNEMQLDLIRQGKCPIQFDADGYMRLYNAKLIREKAERARRRGLEG